MRIKFKALITVVAMIHRIIYWSFVPIYFILSIRPTPKLPRTKSTHLQMSATQIAKKIRNGEVKSRAVVDAYIKRIKSVNHFINAVVQDRFKEAQEDADKVDEYIAANKESLEIIKNEKPLLGVPFTVKESCSVKGMSLAVGCATLKGTLAPDDGEAVKQLKNAGAIPLCVTNTPEMCLSFETNNLVTGCARNPYNFHRTPGGSSGGEGAIIGSGASIFGVGSDLAGSIRVPAAFNGIFGHKPTPGYVSTEGHFPNITEERDKNLVVVGPLARYAEDLSLLFKIVCGDKAPGLNLDEKVDINKLNIFYIEEATSAWYAVPVDKEIKDRIKEAAQFMSDVHGCHVEKGPLEVLAEFAEIGAALILGVEGVPNLLDYSLSANKDQLSLHFEIIKATFGYSEFSVFGTLFNSLVHHKVFTPEEYKKYYQLNKELKVKFQELLKDNGVLFFPTFPKPAFYHNQILMLTYGTIYTMIANTLELPSTHVPTGLNACGLPIGFQVIAAPKQDRLCLAVARALEERFGGWVPPPT